MEARLLWEQEATNLRSVPGFDPEVPDLKHGSRGLVAHTRLITESC